MKPCMLVSAKQNIQGHLSLISTTGARLAFIVPYVHLHSGAHIRDFSD